MGASASGTDVDPARWRELDRAWWDERTPLRVASPRYDVAGSEADGRGLRVAHLPCHHGLEAVTELAER